MVKGFDYPLQFIPPRNCIAGATFRTENFVKLTMTFSERPFGLFDKFG